MLTSPSARAILRLASCVLLLAAGAGVWETLAAQAPGSVLYIGVLPGPVQSLRETALLLGLVIFAAGVLVERAGGALREHEREPTKLVIALHAGALLTLAASIYGACTGMHGEQLLDLRPDALPLFLGKHLGLLIAGSALAELTRRALWRAP